MAASDETSRACKELKEVVEQMPSPALLLIINKWKTRVNEIRSQLRFVNAQGGPSCPATREAETLERVIRETLAAHAMDHGHPMRAFKMLID